ncbi:MAG: carbohydrate ABC transporter substrate-binding protein [Deltaproteobacteria bacterium]|nr:MAG: carbohydrate ABC transporter substrate-binding protein [Deltaproteobacteria bacterium]
MAKITRRQFMKGVVAGGAAVASTMAVPGVVRKAFTAKPSLNIALWNHWIPGAADVHTAIVNEWAVKNNVEVKVDLVGPQVRDIRTIAAAESRARTGHDIIALGPFDSWAFYKQCEPLNDVADYLEKKYGKFDTLGTYLSYSQEDKAWYAIPAPIGSHSYPLVSRTDYFMKYADVDLVDIFPADVNDREASKVDAWNYDAFLKAAKKLHAAGYPFGAAISETSDAMDWLGPLLLSFGSQPMDRDGNITIESDGTMAALEYLKELTQYMPEEDYGSDDASNNRCIISGKGSAIQNPPSAWSVAKRTQPLNAGWMWHHDCPKGPEGRFRGALFYNFILWEWCKEKKAAKELLTYLLEKPQQWKMLTAAQGYDMPQLTPMYEHPVWVQEGPPPGGVYNYVIRGDEQLVVGGYPSHPIAGQAIYSQSILAVMVAKATTGEMSPKDAMKWCASELEMVAG